MGYNLVAELFAEWAVGLVIIAIRLFARWKTGKFYWDDLCLGFVVIFWTFHTVFLYLCTGFLTTGLDVYGSNIGLNEKTALEVPDHQVESLRQGSIHAFIAWLSYIFMVWSFKGVLMFLYNRLTMGLWQHRLAMIISVACVLTFFGSLFFHLFICMPVSRSWQIKPYAGDNCTIRPLNYIVIETLSITTDLGIMCVPIPLVLAARIPTTQKLLLCALFSSGIFVMIAGFLRAYYSVTDISTLSTALGWASREALVSVITVSAPGIKPLVSKTGWFQSYGSGEGRSGAPYGRSAQLSSSKNRRGEFTSSSTGCDGRPYELSSTLGFKKPRRDSCGESEENIINQSAIHGGKESANSQQSSAKDGEGILVTTDVRLSEEDRNSEYADQAPRHQP